MERRSFLKNSALAAGTLSLSMPLLGSQAFGGHEKGLFELRIYHISRAANAKGLLEQYFKDALIPFLNKRKVQFAAFNDYSLEEPVKLYVMLAYPNASAYFTVQSEWFTDPDFLKASGNYNNLPASGAVYTRFETFLLEAFDEFPALSIPAEKKSLFELRIYESASEDAGRRKIMMFNREEIGLFLRVGLIPVFFGRILAGNYMPGLIYMIGFKDMADRDAAWNKFTSHEDWNEMRVRPEYADTVSNIRRIFLTPANSSQI
ncbi:MAG: NIPSNAP family protein [Bacteroidales bacterium]|nr:NIPSNAP family protein [Bacteroidales bacterium]